MRQQTDEQQNRFNSLDDKFDPAMLPMTFPLQDMGVPVPGTTNLQEPPEGLPPPPPLQLPKRAASADLEEGEYSPVEACKTPHRHARMIHNELKVVTE